MAENENKVYIIRVVPFKETTLEWPMWVDKLLVRARRKWYKDFLKGSVIAPNSSDILDESTADGKKDIEALKVNKDTYEDLVFSIEGSTKEGRVAFSKGV